MNLSFDEMGKFQPVIDPPRKKAGCHCKGGGDSPQDEEVETDGLKRVVPKEEMEKNEERSSHQEGNRKVDEHGVRMALRHRESLEEILKHRREVLQLLWCPFLKDSHLGVTLKHFLPMGSCRNLPAQNLSGGMSVHVKTFGPETAFRDIIDLPLKGNIDRVSILPIEG